jgi:hypothetical protein
MKKQTRIIEDLNEERWTIFVDVTGHLCNITKELLDKDKLIIETHDNIKAFKLSFDFGKTRSSINCLPFSTLHT